ncbi:MAG: GTP 3',8-cyclase MoaA [Gammaproteobacteria bacterium]|nr:GTP 3',8-cyclase MoaA [Gammaproteobacteria bacterium]
MTVTDTLHRPLRDLRISVTDRCNFRCPYCMPKEVFGRDWAFLPHAELLSFDEIRQLVRIFVDQGVEKIRITGGEPLLRRDLERLIEMLAPLDGVRDLTLTTNGSLLAGKARSLKDAGLQRVTVSLDALDDDTFQAMNDVAVRVARVLEGIEAAAACGLAPVKVNMVVKRGMNEHCVAELAQHFRYTGHVLRFIEYMDVGNSNGWRTADVVSAAEILTMIESQWPVEPLQANYRGEVARRYRYRDGAGEFGIIASVTQAFCGDCSRLRLTADGQLFTCLFATRGHDLRSLLRSGASDPDIAAFVRAIWGRRTDRYSEIRSAATVGLDKVEMSRVGG